MCGIAGYIAKDKQTLDPEILDRLRDALGHRGPDGDGRFIKGPVGFIQTRLAIIDLNTGDQPLYHENGSTLIANGEIYNYLELRKNLGEAGFKTRSDSETALRIFARDGIGGFDQLRGMYAFAIHDAIDNQVVLCRDPFGIKQIYYVETPEYFAFASEAQALIAAGLVGRKVREDARSELLQVQFTTGADVILDGIKRLLPGETIVLKNGRIVERRRRQVLSDAGAVGNNLDSALYEWDRVFEESVRLHQRSDVDYAMFLSGGVDSASLLGMMHRLNERPVTAYTAAFEASSVHDERELAREVAKACNANHVEVMFSERDFWALLPEVAARMDDPAADYAILPTYKLAKEAARDFKVVLSGEGGDELFGGYGRYRSVMRPFLLGGRVMRSKGTFDKIDVLRPGVLDGWRDGIAASETRENLGKRSRLSIAQAVDCSDWLPNDLLLKLDRMLMAHGLEGRTPFLDPAVAEFAYQLPDRLKVRKGVGKFLLRKWLERCLPMAEPFAKKRGFTVPVSEWISGKGKQLGPLVARQAGVAEIADKGRVEKLFTTAGKREGAACWHLLFYALWHQANVLGHAAGADVFETLESTSQT
ncbi:MULTISPECIES: asparagine synthase (glutamine-hydrolyzing) [Thalassospira]|uniref:asparagine synthase (glutamine-hydrolyzing) n=1 Tax=Thalassospira profundimaris TaxID=502049 RepID=A0A367V3R5_9PROT|nr:MULTISPECIES: asparagine synthase (glutamine-hydrolyzing) [Thalassospira]KZB70635.1 asparagine synthetase B [Thalassospira sp. MCCC 1A01148]RCK19816.1 asparagine synthase [Thalassospira profundimaris]